MKETLIAAALLVAGLAPALAASQAAFETAFAAAEAAEKQAGQMRNQWTTTEAMLETAKQAAAAGDFEAALASAREAEALARASIFQVMSEKERWETLAIH